MNLPFPRSYWVEPGRLLAGFYPGDKDPAERDRKLQALLDCGVTRIFNLMEADETDHSGLPFEDYSDRFTQLARAKGQEVKRERFPIVDRSVPTQAGMTEILCALEAALQKPGAVYVHCWGGRGRTGTVIGCHLRHAKNLSGTEALSLLAELTNHHRKAFWPAPEMPGQRAFIEQWNP